jgi:hypothetical protein
VAALDRVLARTTATVRADLPLPPPAAAASRLHAGEVSPLPVLTLPAT